MAADTFKAARDFLLAHRTDYATACRDFRWPEPTHFNWALDWFDAELARGDGAGRPALTIVGDGAGSLTFAELSERSSRLAGVEQRRADFHLAECDRNSFVQEQVEHHLVGREALPDFVGGDQVRGEHVGHPRCGLTVEKQDAGNAGHLAAVGQLERVGLVAGSPGRFHAQLLAVGFDPEPFGHARVGL